MEPQPPPQPPKPQVPKPPPAYVYIFKVLDHCGCLMCATYFNNIPENLEYYSACDNCRDNLCYEQYQCIYYMCIDELQRYPLHILTHQRGWITKHEAVKILNRKQNSNRSNGKVLTVRMDFETPRVEKIENAPVVDDDVNPS